MKSFFGPVPINRLKIKPSITNENWRCFKIISDLNFTVNCPLVPCNLSSVNVNKAYGCIKTVLWPSYSNLGACN